MFKVVYKKPFQDAEVLTYEDSQKDFNYEIIQKLVEGPFESVAVNFNGKSFTVYCNEEGKLREMYPNFLLVEGDECYDILDGPAIFLSSEVDDEGYELSLTDDEIKTAIDYCNITDIRMYASEEDLKYAYRI